MNTNFYIVILLLFIVLAKDQTQLYEDLLGKQINFYVESGYIKLTKIDDNTKEAGAYFYQLILKDGYKSLNEIQDGDNLLLWLNGGPGCSSQLGNYQEFGPFQFTTDAQGKYTISERTTSWNKQTHLLFVDQPFNVGMSWSNEQKLILGSDQVAKYFTQFLTKFFEQKETLRKTNFYMSGESYGGHYVPAISREFVQNNQFNVKFKGVAIGNGWTFPYEQAPYFASFLTSIGTIDQKAKADINGWIVYAQQLILDGDYELASSIVTIGELQVGEITGGMDHYHIQKYNYVEDPGYINFLNDNLDKFESPITKFVEQSEAVYLSFFNDFTRSRADDVAYLLNNNFKVLLFNGQLDMAVTTSGATRWINTLKWDKINEWKKVSKTTFSDGTKTLGSIKELDNFTFMVIYNAGHMVPADNPYSAELMIQRFLQ